MSRHVVLLRALLSVCVVTVTWCHEDLVTYTSCSADGDLHLTCPGDAILVPYQDAIVAHVPNDTWSMQHCPLEGATCMARSPLFAERCHFRSTCSISGYELGRDARRHLANCGLPNFLRIRYRCISVLKTSDICGSVSRSGPVTYISAPSLTSRMPRDPVTCQCDVTTRGDVTVLVNFLGVYLRDGECRESIYVRYQDAIGEHMVDSVCSRSNILGMRSATCRVLESGVLTITFNKTGLGSSSSFLLKLINISPVLGYSMDVSCRSLRVAPLPRGNPNNTTPRTTTPRDDPTPTPPDRHPPQADMPTLTHEVRTPAAPLQQLSTGAVGGIVAGGFVLLMLFTLLAICLYKPREKHTYQPQYDNLSRRTSNISYLSKISDVTKDGVSVISVLREPDTRDPALPLYTTLDSYLGMSSPSTPYGSIRSTHRVISV